MSFGLEVEKDSPRVAFFVCVEGLGWLVDEGDKSQGFDGTVFATNALGGDLLTTLGCSTVLDRLHLPKSFSDSIAQHTYEYSGAGLSFTVTETEDDAILDTYFRPNIAGLQDVLWGGIAWDSNNPIIDNANQSWDNGDIIWVGGSEAILLAGKVNILGTIYQYTGSTRGYLGTTRGRRSGTPSAKAGFTWGDGQKFVDWNPYWWNRRVYVYGLAVGDSVDQVQLLFTGRFRGAKEKSYGTEWEFMAVSEALGDGGGATATRVRPSEQVLVKNQLRINTNIMNVYNYSDVRRWCVFDYNRTGVDSDWERLALAFTYDYRNRIAGGTIGAYLAAQATNPQAPLTADGFYNNFSMFDIDGHFLRGIGAHPTAVSYASYRHLAIEGYSLERYSGVLNPTAPIDSDANEFPEGTPVALCLEMRKTLPEQCWFTVQNTVRDNIIDLALICLTSMDDEFAIFDAANAAGGSTVSSIVQSGVGTFELDRWNGYALHCVTGPNQGEALPILDTTATAIVVDGEFTTTPDTGDEYQVRNTIYDVLPLGWGMNKHHSHIDIAAFETLRDRYFSNDVVDDFIISAKGKYDVWNTINKNLLQPFGISCIKDRLTAKLTPHFIEMAIQDDLFENFETIEADEILYISDIDHMPSKAAGTIVVNVRDRAKILKTILSKSDVVSNWIPDVIGVQAENAGVQPATSGQAKPVTIQDADLDAHFGTDDLETLTYSAMFHSVKSVHRLAARMRARLLRTATHTPTCTIKCTFDVLRRISTGMTVAITDTTVHNPPDPYTGNRGWTGRLAIILGTRIVFDDSEPHVEYSVQLWPTQNYTRIAPAALVVAKGNDGTYDYLEIDINGMADIDTSVEDWDNFAIGDYITLYNADGTPVATDEEHTIHSFGNTHEADSDDANPAFPRINITGAVTATITAGDYITFAEWDAAAANSNNMNVHSAFADDDNLLGPNDDDATLYI